MPTIDQIRAEALRALMPPPRLRLSEWIEREVCLPEGVSSQPGPVRLWPFQREIADAIGDPLIERVTLVKPVRVGFTTLLTSAVASFVANDPAPILCLLPAESDCRVVSRMWWKLASSALRACNVGSGQAARSRDIGTRG
ncbi:phage terminase large subunit family protein [Paenirhodobacter sp.]|uniref:phage terminase large subunit family protein n=1 Tax=Paenirhodobacter sp. TaxID=1965326 RepID=UPI003B50658A